MTLKGAHHTRKIKGTGGPGGEGGFGQLNGLMYTYVTVLLKKQMSGH